MSEFKHTPGPWVFYADLPSMDPNWHIVTTANRMRVLANVHIEPGNAMDLANARLIAAAPEMLEMLTVTLGNLRSLKASCNCTTYDVWIETVEQVIAKATGAE